MVVKRMAATTRREAKPAATARVLDGAATVIGVVALVASAWRAGRTRAHNGDTAQAEGAPAAPAVEQRSGVLGRIDVFQQRRVPLAFAVGVFRKFGDDRAGRLAALIAYYGFFSLFPLRSSPK